MKSPPSTPQLYSIMDDELPARLIARLLAERAIARSDQLAQRVLIDEAFRDEVNRRLESCGLKLLDNPYADHIGAGVNDDAERAIFGSGDQWLSNNVGLQRDGVALLVLLWALIVLPKRERQMTRAEEDQTDMFAAAKPMPNASEVSRGIPETVLAQDYAKQVGGKMRLNVNLGILSRLGFIKRHNRIIYEGPLLDLAFDYAELAPRIIQGALGDLLAQRAIGKTKEQPEPPIPSPLTGDG